MRMTPEELERATGRLLPATQARWFKQHFGVDVAYDRQGPIITDVLSIGLGEQRVSHESLQ